ncbi:hypothetical protein C0J52_22947 [Blattella germanica]|nr:hypothetical protein C0J52_22947 [Blattella germanica]
MPDITEEAYVPDPTSHEITIPVNIPKIQKLIQSEPQTAQHAILKTCRDTLLAVASQESNQVTVLKDGFTFLRMYRIEKKCIHLATFQQLIIIFYYRDHSMSKKSENHLISSENEEEIASQDEDVSALNDVDPHVKCARIKLDESIMLEMHDSLNYRYMLDYFVSEDKGSEDRDYHKLIEPTDTLVDKNLVPQEIKGILSRMDPNKATREDGKKNIVQDNSVSCPPKRTDAKNCKMISLDNHLPLIRAYVVLDPLYKRLLQKFVYNVWGMIEELSLIHFRVARDMVEPVLRTRLQCVHIPRELRLTISRTLKEPAPFVQCQNDVVHKSIRQMLTSMFNKQINTILTKIKLSFKILVFRTMVHIRYSHRLSADRQRLVKIAMRPLRSNQRLPTEPPSTNCSRRDIYHVQNQPFGNDMNPTWANLSCEIQMEFTAEHRTFFLQFYEDQLAVNSHKRYPSSVFISNTTSSLEFVHHVLNGMSGSRSWFVKFAREIVPRFVICHSTQSFNFIMGRSKPVFKKQKFKGNMYTKKKPGPVLPSNDKVSKSFFKVGNGLSDLCSGTDEDEVKTSGYSHSVESSFSSHVNKIST